MQSRWQLGESFGNWHTHNAHAYICSSTSATWGQGEHVPPTWFTELCLGTLRRVRCRCRQESGRAPAFCSSKQHPRTSVQ